MIRLKQFATKVANVLGDGMIVIAELIAAILTGV